MKIALWSILVLVLSSCVKNNPAPVWLEVTEWTLEKNPDEQTISGTLTHNFTDAWVYIDGNIVGVFEVPFKIPLLYTGTHKISLYPAIKNNGISATKKIYPFVQAFQLETEFLENETIHIDPVTRYEANTKFWIEDFEDPAVKLNSATESLATMVRTDDGPGTNSYGRVDLNTTENLWHAYTNSDPSGMTFSVGQEAYLELDYYNTNYVETGVLAITSSSTDYHVNIGLNAQDESTVEWKKIYIDIKEIVSYSGGNFFEQVFKATLDDGKLSTVIKLDNIKVVKF